MLGMVLAAAPSQAACRLALALGLDVSASVGTRDYRLQMGGTAAALRAPAVRAALLQGEPVALAAYLWSGQREHWLVLDWTPIDGDAALERFAATLERTGRPPFDGRTATGAAMDAGLGLLRQAPDCARLTLDLATDGVANDGVDPGEVAAGAVTVNALAIGEEGPTGRSSLPPDEALTDWLLRDVIRGPGGFVEAAAGFADFERAMTEKLLRELGGMAVSETAGTGPRGG